MQNARVHLQNDKYMTIIDNNHLAVWTMENNNRSFRVLCQLELPAWGHGKTTFVLQNTPRSPGPTSIQEGLGLVAISVWSSGIASELLIDVHAALLKIGSSSSTDHRLSWKEWSSCTRLCTGDKLAVYGGRVAIYHNLPVFLSEDPERTHRWTVLEFFHLNRSLSSSTYHPLIDSVRFIQGSDVLGTDYLRSSPWERTSWANGSLPCIEFSTRGPPCSSDGWIYMDADRLVLMPVSFPLQSSVLDIS